jgi:hypothetical protein|tara:strand:- start:262 stop:627 length:366 start_codon:yes stop_codon:yes gene_type:complete
MTDTDLHLLAVVTDRTDVLGQLLAGPSLDALAFCFRVDGRWYTSTTPQDLAQGDCWGLPVVWRGEVLLPNCDRLVRCVLRRRSPDGAAHYPVRSYDAYSVGEWVHDWARELDAEVVEVTDG